MVVFLEGFHRRLLRGGLFYTLSNGHFFLALPLDRGECFSGGVP